MDGAPGIVIALLFLLILGAGFGPGFDLGLSGTDAPRYVPQAADARCVSLWNESAGTTAGQRQLLGMRSAEVVVHVERLRNATTASGNCGIVLANRADGQTIATFVWGHQGAAGYTDVTGNPAARMYGRADSASRVNAVMREDGTLVAITPPSG